MFLDKIGFGTWDLNNIENNISAESSIRNAIEMGIRHIDTAEAYDNGCIEKIIGDALKDTTRNNIFLATKVRDSKLDYSSILNECEQSLKRLQTEYIDLYYVHKPSLIIPIKETSKALNKLYRDKVIKNVGLSNCSVNTIKEYQKHLTMPIFAVQCQYNLIAREPQKTKLLNFCEEENIKFIAYRPLQPTVTNLGIKSLVNEGNYPLLDKIARKYKLSNAQVAIAWLIQQHNVHTIFKTSNIKHLKEVFDVQNIKIMKDDIELLTKDFSPQFDKSFTMKRFSSLI